MTLYFLKIATTMIANLPDEGGHDNKSKATELHY